MEQENTVKEKKYTGLKVANAIVIILATLFVIWCIIVTLYPKYQETYANEVYTGEDPETLTSVTYTGSDISDYFTFTGGRKEYIAIRSVVSVRKEYHYELTFSSTDLYFMVESLDVTVICENGQAEVPFELTKMNLTKGALHLVSETDLGSIVSYSPSSTSVIVGYTAG